MLYNAIANYAILTTIWIMGLKAWAKNCNKKTKIKQKSKIKILIDSNRSKTRT